MLRTAPVLTAGQSRPWESNLDVLFTYGPHFGILDQAIFV
jgi:hypothetical protein